MRPDRGPQTGPRTQPAPGRAPDSGRSGIVERPGTRTPADGGRRGPEVGGERGFRGDGGDRVRAGFGPRADVRAGVASQPFRGNTINIRNQSINVAGSGYRPSFYRHPSYNGFWGWNGGWGWGPGLAWGYGPGWSYGWGGGWWGGYGWRPLGWGLGAWGLGALAYTAGYLPYYNPYYASVGPMVYDYAEPIPVAYDTTAVAANSGRRADEMLNDAIAAFRQNDYDTALQIGNEIVRKYPDDAVAHEFRGLVLFAKGDYQQSAATIHSVLAVGPGWDWATMRRMYADVSVYTSQLRTLEGFVREHPDDAGARFLLGYHYMSGGHQDAAGHQFERVAALVPDDRVAADLAKLASTPQSTASAAAGYADRGEEPTPRPPAEAERPEPDGPSINPASLVGTWRAERDDGSRFELTLDRDKTFSWRFTPPKGQKPQELSGKYTVEGNVLALERKEGGALVGEVTPNGRDEFNFKLAGGPSSDKGLEFAR